MILAKWVLLRLLTGDCGGQFLRSSFFYKKRLALFYFIYKTKQNTESFICFHRSQWEIRIFTLHWYTWIFWGGCWNMFWICIQWKIWRKDRIVWEKMDAFEAKLQHNYSKQMPYHFHPCQRIHFCQENASWTFIWTGCRSYSFQMDPTLGKQLLDKEFR